MFKGTSSAFHALELRPVLMIERGSGFDDVRRFLKDVGYGFFIYDVPADHMIKCDEPSVTNFLALPTAANGNFGRVDMSFWLRSVNQQHHRPTTEDHIEFTPQ